ncbi:hypothetical protein F511_41549 [Dorcoceras hygrometricum]|uniref:Uncharacterized protein n=1 Tax=Dorcoceras hygrometricum TaxID=472368 RepID=A0A2Z7AF59_9LAMI|nr:hypothetical protein F511_41549 [Dorcoceras hygrometricum]
MKISKLEHSTRITFKVSSKNWLNQPMFKSVCLLMVWIRCLNGPREQASNTGLLMRIKEPSWLRTNQFELEQPARRRGNQIGEIWSGWMLMRDDDGEAEGFCCGRSVQLERKPVGKQAQSLEEFEIWRTASCNEQASSAADKSRKEQNKGISECSRADQANRDSI